jgi:hypothetical protein
VDPSVEGAADERRQPRCDEACVAVGLERNRKNRDRGGPPVLRGDRRFATSEIIFINELAIGTALALLGQANLWAPAPLPVLHFDASA